jgi:enamine deaminase RidA (YjgF/YER057c/UK114 family)
MNGIETRLRDLGIVLPCPVPPVANYVPFVLSGNLLFISGQLPFGPSGKIAPHHIGKLGREIFNEAGQEAARIAAINVLAQAKVALAGRLDKVRRCVRLVGYLNCMPDFAALPAVMNGASDLMVDVLGDSGRHARTTIGVAELPLDCAVEVDAIFEVE